MTYTYLNPYSFRLSFLNASTSSFARTAYSNRQKIMQCASRYERYSYPDEFHRRHCLLS